MANKKITDLQLVSAITDSANFPLDDGIQTYRGTGPQIYDYLLPKFSASRTISAAASALTLADRVVYLDPTSSSFTQALPALSGVPANWTVTFLNIATNGNYVTLDADSTETIDGATTKIVNSSPFRDGVTLIKKSTGWFTLNVYIPDLGVTRAKMAVGAIANGTVVSIANAQSPYTQVENADLYEINGTSGVTFGLLTASSYSGKLVVLRKTDATVGVVTITGITTLNTQGETVWLRSNGSTWIVVNRHIPCVTTSVTMTTNMSSNGTVTAFMTRKGDRARLEWQIAWTGATGAVSMTLDLPSGIVIDTAKIASSTAAHLILGEGIHFDPAGGTTRYGTKILYSDSDTVQVYYSAVAGSFTHYTSITNTSPYTIGSGSYSSGYIDIPVSGWAAA